MSVLRPPAILGLLGGGQLGRYFVQAAQELGYRVWVLDPDDSSPAGRIADRHLARPYDDRTALDELGNTCGAVTTEFENVPAASLEYLAGLTVVRPAASAVAICQDRSAEKRFLLDHGFPHGPFAVILAADDIDRAPDSLFPGILKSARFGYDGKGQHRIADRAGARSAFTTMGGRPCVLEALLPLDLEVSVVLARTAAGETACFPVIENHHRDGILDMSIAPARVSPAIADEALDIARRIAAALDYVGTLGVEFFVSGGRLYVNEIAPRPHNSGHYTLDACLTSQYEQQVRALCGLPPGEPGTRDAAVMVNLLGDLWFREGSAREPDWSVLWPVPGLKLHFYGKTQARPGRKMGHFTVIGPHRDAVLAAALAARARIGIADPEGAP